jgi:hypothetical protein
MPFREECRFDSDRPHHFVFVIQVDPEPGLGSPLQRRNGPNGHRRLAKWQPNVCHAGHQNPERDLAIAYQSYFLTASRSPPHVDSNLRQRIALGWTACAQLR